MFLMVTLPVARVSAFGVADGVRVGMGRSELLANLVTLAILAGPLSKPFGRFYGRGRRRESGTGARGEVRGGGAIAPV